MIKTTRSKARIDYGVLSSTGENVEDIFEKSHDDFDKQSVRELSTLFSKSCSEFKMKDKKNVHLQLSTEESTISEDINDFIDENPIEISCDSIEDIDEIISKTEKIRSYYRSKHKELQAIHV